MDRDRKTASQPDRHRDKTVKTDKNRLRWMDDKYKGREGPIVLRPTCKEVPFQIYMYLV